MYTQTGALLPRRTVRVELQRAHRPGTGARRPATGTDVQVVGSHTDARTDRLNARKYRQADRRQTGVERADRPMHGQHASHTHTFVRGAT